MWESWVWKYNSEDWMAWADVMGMSLRRNLKCFPHEYLLSVMDRALGPSEMAPQVKHWELVEEKGNLGCFCSCTVS